MLILSRHSLASVDIASGGKLADCYSPFRFFADLGVSPNFPFNLVYTLVFTAARIGYKDFRLSIFMDSVTWSDLKVDRDLFEIIPITERSCKRIKCVSGLVCIKELLLL